MDVIMVGTWMLCGNGLSLWERHHGCHMHALWEWIEFVGTVSWLPHGYSVGMDRVCGNVIMVATWILCRNRWSLWERYQGCHMDALREWVKSDLDVITVGKSPFGKKALLPPPPSPRPSTSEFVGRARVFLA